jgi:hypothetical protein
LTLSNTSALFSETPRQFCQNSGAAAAFRSAADFLDL